MSSLSLLNNDSQTEGDHKEDKKIQKDKKDDKIFIVVLPDTYPQPRTMMIITLDTMITISTMNSSKRSIDMTFDTIFSLYTKSPMIDHKDVFLHLHRMIYCWQL